MQLSPQFGYGVVEMLGPEWFDQSEVQKAIEYIQTIEPEYKP